MNQETLRELDFASYRELLNALLPRGFEFALTDPEGNPIWRDPDFPMQALSLAVPELQNARGKSKDPVPVASESGSGCAFVAPVRIDNDGLVASIWAVAPDEVHPPASVRWLGTVAEHIAKEVAMASELNSIATELGERYEELNLVYHTEDQVNYYVEGQQALNQLVRNCCDYLDVNLAVLILKDKGIALAHQSGEDDDANSQVLIQRIQSGVYSAVMESGVALVVNEATDPEAERGWNGLPYRLLATPIEAVQGGVGGILAIVNGLDRPKFANSDKNLLQVMARKAGKILQVSFDNLTGLMSRDGVEYLASQLLRDAQTRESCHCVLHLDIDQLHVINDTISYEAGDAIILAIAAYLRQATRDTDMVGRLGGDEMIVLLRQCSVDRGTELADKLREGIAELTVPWQEQFLTATISIGIAPIDMHTPSAASAIASAELACDAAKEAGKNRVRNFQHGDTSLVKRHREMEAVGKIQKALKQNRLELYAQIIEPVDAALSGAHLEVLIRMTDEDGNLVQPGSFIPAAERYHLMPEIDRWVIENLFATLSAPEFRFTRKIDSVSVNLSGQTLNQSGFDSWLIENLKALRFPAASICFEITETAVVANLDEACAFMRAVKACGCQFSLDDFGSGLSSFGYLRALPVDYLKIDGSIVLGIDDDPISASMVAAVKQVADVMNLKTIAEFVESDAILQKLREIGVTYAQGYALGKPQRLADFIHSETLGSEAIGA